MNKELNYLSLPDYFNKLLLINFNEKINKKKNISLQFKMSNTNHLGSALKAIYLLEVIFPKKAFVLKIFLKKKKKIYFGQKIKNNIFFFFTLNIYVYSFIEFYRFFLKTPLNYRKNKLDDIIIVNKKLKQFDFNNNLLLSYNNLDSSFYFFKTYHLN